MGTEKTEELGEEDNGDSNEFSQFISYQKHDNNITLAQCIQKDNSDSVKQEKKGK